MIDISYYLILSFVLFTIGFVGVLIRRNSIIIFMCIELMLSAVNVLLVAFSTMHHKRYIDGFSTLSQNGSDAQVFVFFIMIVAAVEVAVGLSIIVMIYRNTHSIDINELNRLKH